MEIKDKMWQGMNKQITEEFFASYLYLSMAAYFEAENLPGFAHWMRVQSREENEHATKFFDFILERGSSVELGAIEKPKTSWKSAVEAFQDAYEHEKKVTGLINTLVKITREENDYASEIMLQWFVTEQVEEEANALHILDTLKVLEGSKQGLIMMDRELGKRKEEEDD